MKQSITAIIPIDRDYDFLAVLDYVETEVKNLIKKTRKKNLLRDPDNSYNCCEKGSYGIFYFLFTVQGEVRKVSIGFNNEFDFQDEFPGDNILIQCSDWGLGEDIIRSIGAGVASKINANCYLTFDSSEVISRIA